MQFPALDERGRGRQIREGYGRQEPGTTPGHYLCWAVLRIPRPSLVEGRGVNWEETS